MDSVNNHVEGVIESAASFSGYTRKQKILLGSSLVAEFLACACLSLPAPFLPKLDESHHIKSDLTGWILGVFPLVQLIMNPLWGKLASYISPEFILIYGMFTNGVATILFGLLEYMPLPPPSENQVDVTYLTIALLLRIVQAAGVSAIITSAMLLLSTRFPDNKLTIMSYSEVAAGMGEMSGPALGSGLYKLGGFKLVFYGVGGLMLLLFIITRCILPHNVVRQGVNGTREKTSIKLIFTNGNIILSFVITALSGCLWTNIDPILEPELRNKFNLSEELCSLAFLLMSATYILVTPMVAKLLEKMKVLDSHTALIIGLATSSLAFIFMGPAPFLQGLYRPLWLLLVGIGVVGGANAFFIVPCLELLSHDENSKEAGNKMNESTQAFALSIWMSMFGLGAFIGPTFSGIATRHGTFGWTMTYYSIGCMAMAAVVVVIKCVRSCKGKCGSQQSRGETTPLLDNHA